MRLFDEIPDLKHELCFGSGIFIAVTKKDKLIKKESGSFAVLFLFPMEETALAASVIAL